MGNDFQKKKTPEQVNHIFRDAALALVIPRVPLNPRTYNYR